LAKSAAVSGGAVANTSGKEIVLEEAVYMCEVEMGEEEEVIVLSDEELDLPEGNPGRGG